MAKNKLASDAFLKNAEKRIRKTVLKGEKAFATSDGQVFARAATESERKRHAQNHAFNFKPPLIVAEYVGEMVPKVENPEKRKLQEVIDDINNSESIEAVKSLSEGDGRVRVRKAAADKIEIFLINLDKEE